MKILDEPISTWISIAAFLISLSTLLLALRKQKNDERLVLAGKVTEIKALYGETVRAINEILESLSIIENIAKKSFSVKETTSVDADTLESLDKSHSDLENLRNEIERTYKTLGHEDPNTTDPLVLSAIAVEMNDIKKNLEKYKNDIEDIAAHLKSRNKEKSKKSPNIKVQHKKQLKKDGVTGKRLKRPANAG